MNRHIAQPIALAHEALAKATNGALPLPNRKQIWLALDGPNENSPAEGPLRRAKLALLCAIKVRPIWEQHFTANQQYSALLQKLEGHLQQPDMKDTLRQEVGRFWSLLDDFSADAEGNTLNALIAGYALGAAGWVVLADERFDPTQDIDATQDSDLDPDMMDAALLASDAYAGSEQWEAENDPDRRRAFWQWYLVEAVPAVAP